MVVKLKKQTCGTYII